MPNHFLNCCFTDLVKSKTSIIDIYNYIDKKQSKTLHNVHIKNLYFLHHCFLHHVMESETVLLFLIFKKLKIYYFTNICCHFHRFETL